MSKKRGFTLTEVLITLGIIGVVSALTIPTLVNNYQTKALSIQIRKAVLDIENQLDMLITEEGKTSLGATSIGTEAGLDNFMKTHFKVLKTCKSTDTSECFANQAYIAIQGNKTSNFSCPGTSYLLANSVVVCAKLAQTVNVEVKEEVSSSSVSLPLAKGEDKYTQNTKGVNIELYIDTNGQEGPNVGGRDMFHMFIQPDGRIYDEAVKDNIVCKIPGGNIEMGVCMDDGSFEVKEVTKDCKTSPVGDGCIEALEQNNWVMNY